MLVAGARRLRRSRCSAPPRVHGFWSLARCSCSVAGLTGASVQSASGRAVMALVPGRGSAASRSASGRRRSRSAASRRRSRSRRSCARAASAGASRRSASPASSRRAVGGLVLREGPRARAERRAPTVAPLRDRRLWRSSVGSALVLAPQMCVVGFTVLFLHDQRGLSPARPPPCSRSCSCSAIARPHRRGALVGRARRRGSARCARSRSPIAVLVARHGGARSTRRSSLLCRSLVVAGVLSMSWNGLSFAAAVELAGHGAERRRDRAAADAAERLRRGLSRRSSACSSPRRRGASGFVAVALFPLAGWRVCEHCRG